MRSLFNALVVAAIAACSATTAPVLTPSPAESTAPATQTSTPTSTPTVAATGVATAFPTPTPIADISQVFHQLANGWRPSGPTLVLGSSDASGSTVIALPFDANGTTGAATPIVKVAGSWDIRADGGAIATAVGTDRGVRIATWDVRSGTAAWVTPADAAAIPFRPIWSKDGAWLYSASSNFSPPDFKGTVYRIRPDGTGKSDIATLDRFGGFERLTPDGAGLIWSRGQAGGSTEILDLATGLNRHLNDVARVASIRARQPRVLLSVGGCCAGRPGGSLVLWDDAAMTSRTVAERPPSSAVAWGGGSWDPSGTRIAAVRYDETSPYDGTLVLLDPVTGVAQPFAGTLGAGQVLWLDEGIVLTVVLQRSPVVDLLLVSPSGGTPLSLYKGSNMGVIAVVRP